MPGAFGQERSAKRCGFCPWKDMLSSNGKHQSVAKVGHDPKWKFAICVIGLRWSQEWLHRRYIWDFTEVEQGYIFDG